MSVQTSEEKVLLVLESLALRSQIWEEQKQACGVSISKTGSSKPGSPSTGKTAS